MNRPPRFNGYGQKVWDRVGHARLRVVTERTPAIAVAEAVDVKPSTISRLARGLTEEPSLRVAHELELQFGIPHDSWLIDSTDDEDELRQRNEKPSTIPKKPRGAA